MTELLLKNSRKRGRPRKGWTQADTARELGISQQSLSNAIQIARAIELIPELARFKGTAILKALRAIRDPDGDAFSKLNKEGLEAFMFLADWLKQKRGKRS